MTVKKSVCLTVGSFADFRSIALDEAVEKLGTLFCLWRTPPAYVRPPHPLTANTLNG